MTPEPLYYAPSIDANRKKLQQVQDVVSLALGVAAGILTLELVGGFVLYAIGFTLANTAFWAYCCGTKGEQFFQKPVNEIFVQGVASSVPGYVMMWCLVSALVK